LEVERLDKELAARAGGNGVIDEPLLCQVLQWRLSEEDAARGSIIDGLENSHGIGQEMAVRCLRQVSPHVVMMHLDIDQEAYVQLLRKIDGDTIALLDEYAHQQQQQQRADDVINESSAGTTPPQSEKGKAGEAVSSWLMKQSSHVSNASCGPNKIVAPSITAESFAAAERLHQNLAQLYDTTTATLKEASPYHSYLSTLPSIVTILETPPPQPPTPHSDEQQEETEQQESQQQQQQQEEKMPSE